MNLHGIVSGAIGTVNPFIPATIKQSLGVQTIPGGERVPTYSDPIDVSIQRQELTQRDLRQLEGVSVQGIYTAAYLNGNYYGIVRNEGTGGDIFTFQGNDWLLVAVSEMWPDWCRVLLCQQLSQ